MWCKNEAFIFFLVFFSGVANSLIDPQIISRDEWKAKEPKSIQNMENPVPYVVIHHSYMPSACYNLEDCIGAMQWIQNLHQLKNGWVDIGYSFAVGSDGRAYEGRGWSRVGAHAPFFNNKSIGICVIGDWRDSLPPAEQLATVRQLIRMGVRDGKIARDYRLVGHKQVRYGTLCPGGKLHDEIKSWPNYYNCSPETVPELKGTLPIGATPIEAPPTGTPPNTATPTENTPEEAAPTEDTPIGTTLRDITLEEDTPTETTPSEAPPSKGTPSEDGNDENRLRKRAPSFS